MKKIYEEPKLSAMTLNVPDVLTISGEDEFEGNWEEDEEP